MVEFFKVNLKREVQGKGNFSDLSGHYLERNCYAFNGKALDTASGREL